MALRRLFDPALLIVAVLAIVLVLVMPSTRHVASRSVRIVLIPRHSLLIGPVPEQGITRFSGAHPRDLDISIVHALLAAGVYAGQSGSPISIGIRSMDRLEPLDARFPGQPALYAVILRYGTAIEFSGSTPDEHVFFPSSFSLQTPIELQELRREQVVLRPFYRRLIKDALEGEKLDPDNAFFPWMHASLLFQLGQSADAEREISSAANLSRWSEYRGVEDSGKLKIEHALIGSIDAISSSSFLRGNADRHDFVLRETAQLAVIQAIRDEMSGQPIPGLLLRQSVLRGGNLIRCQSTDLLGSFAGCAIEQIVTQSPGGQQPASGSPARSGLDVQQQRNQRYCAYLAAHGYPYESQWTAGELTTASALTNAVIVAMNSGKGLSSDLALSALWLGAATVMLASSFWTIVFVFTVTGVRWAASKLSRPLLLILMIAVALLVLACGLLLLEQSVDVALVLALGRALSILGSRSSGGSLGSSPGSIYVVAACLLFVPAVLLITLFIPTRVHRSTFGQQVDRHLRRDGLAAAAILLILFSAAVVPASRQEQAALTALSDSAANETQFLLSSAGIKSPPNIPPPALPAQNGMPH